MTAIDPGGGGGSGPPPNGDDDDDGGGGRPVATEAEGEAPPPSQCQEVEELSVRRLSLQATGGGAEEQEGEETKTREEAGPMDSEHTTTETDGEEGI